MAMLDLNHDGKNDVFDDFLEHEIINSEEKQEKANTFETPVRNSYKNTSGGLPPFVREHPTFCTIISTVLLLTIALLMGFAFGQILIGLSTLWYKIQKII